MLSFEWFDPRLQWNLTTGGDALGFDLPAPMIWTPKVSLLNGVSESLFISFDNSSSVSVFNTGAILLFAAKQFRASCAQNLMNFPFDTQRCTFFFQNSDFALMRSSERIYFNVPDDRKRVNTELYVPTGEFTFVDSEVRNATLTITQFGMKFPGFTISLMFKRNPTYYVTTIVVPSIFLLCKYTHSTDS